jgi:hypothetical protein
MVQPLRWWVIPGALVVLARVVTLGDVPAPAGPGRPAPAPAPLAEVAAPAGPVVVRDASGHRQGPLTLGVEGALVLSLPAECAGQRVQLTLWRRSAAGRETSPWLVAEPRVRPDAVVPIASQPAGRYDIEVRIGEGPTQRLQRNDVELPGAVDLRTAR